ncbi:MAG: hypothetical protein QXU17_03975, partial [Archaeoglobaceae archaeon]
EDFLLVHVTLIPLDAGGEQKTKPTQHSVKELRELGLYPDVIVGRCKEKLKESTKRKIALFCDVEGGGDQQRGLRHLRSPAEVQRREA